MMDLKRQRRTVGIVLAISYITCFMRFIPINNQVGDEGTGYFAAAFLLFLIYSAWMLEAFSGIVARMVSSRMKREQYRNARHIFEFTLGAGTMVGLIVMLAVLVLAKFLAVVVLGMPDAVYILRYMAPGYLFVAVIAVISGYLKGSGEIVNDALLRLGYELLTTLLCIILSGVLWKKGAKVAALLKQDSFKAVYGAQGCGIAVSIAAFLAMLIYILFYLHTKVAFKRRLMKDATIKEEEQSVYAHILFVSSAPQYAAMLLISVILLVNERLLVKNINRGTAAGLLLPTPAASYGVYFGKVFVLGMIPLACFYAAYQGLSLLVRKASAQDDRKGIREQLQQRIRRYFLIAFPLAGFIAVFRAPLLQTLCNGETESGLTALLMTALAVIGYGVAILMEQVLSGLDKSIYLCGVNLIALIAQIIVINIGMSGTDQLLMVLGLANVVSSVLMAVLSGVLMTLQLNYSHQLIHLVKPLIATLVASLIGFVIAILGGKVMGDLTTLLLGLILYALFYLIMIVVLRGLTKKELSRIPCGRFLMNLIYPSNY